MGRFYLFVIAGAVCWVSSFWYPQANEVAFYFNLVAMGVLVGLAR